MFEYGAKVVSVVDGDTVDLSVDLGFDVQFNQRFRLYGINAPETHSKDAAEKKKGLETMNWLKEKLPVGTEVIVKTEKDKQEKFGRYLASIVLQGMDLNKNMVMLGFAKEYFGGKR